MFDFGSLIGHSEKDARKILNDSGYNNIEKSNNIVKDVHLPILILHNQHISCLHDFNKNEPYLEFIVGAMV